MLVSVIIPNYNNEKFIEKCLNSVLEQTYEEIEIIVADDFSTDNSREILKIYEKKYKNFKCIYYDRNRGVSYTRHNAILQAKGDYITMLDSDDMYLNSKKIENEMNLIKEYKEKYNKEIIAFSKVKLIDQNDEEINEKNEYYYMEGNILFNLISHRKVRYTPRDFCVRREIYLEVGGYNLEYPLYEDLDLDIRLANKCEFYSTREVGTGYRQHENGLSSKSENEHIKYLKIILNSNLHLLKYWKRKIAYIIFNLKLLKLRL